MKRRFVRWIAFSHTCGIVLGAGTAWLVTAGRHPPPPRSPPPVTNSIAEAPKPISMHWLGRSKETIRFRVQEAGSDTPIGFAHIRIDNLNLAPELGESSEAVAWPDGIAEISHRFFVFEEQVGDAKTARRSHEGPWVTVSAAGFQTRTLPLAGAIRDAVVGLSRFPAREAVITLRAATTNSIELTTLFGDFEIATGFVGLRLNVSAPGRYQYREWDDVIRPDDPHDEPEFSGACTVVDGALRLVPSGPFSSANPFLKGNLVPIPWGDRCFLVPENRRLTVCSQVNAGLMPLFPSRGAGRFPNQDGAPPPKGLPKVPAEWKPFLLREPVLGRVTEVISRATAIA
jgi:hypothetical protein